MHRILLTDTNGKRQQLYLGRIPKKTAEGVYRCVEELERATVYGSTPADFASRWLTTISADFHERLVKFGLASSRVAREPAPAVVTLSCLIAKYQQRPKWATIAEGTRVNHRYSFKHMMDYFGADRDITTITETDAEDMIAAFEQKFAEATAARIAGAGSMVMRYGVRSRLLPVNPFEGTKRGSFITKHKAYVEAKTCPDLENEARCGARQILGPPDALRAPCAALARRGLVRASVPLRFAQDWPARRSHRAGGHVTVGATVRRRS